MVASVPPLPVKDVVLTLSFPNRNVFTSQKPPIASIAGIAAAFGPSLASPSLPAAFAFGNPAVTLALPHPDDSLGCVPLQADDPDYPLAGAVLLLRRGDCTFAQKAHLAWLAGAKAVLVANSELVDEELGTGAPSLGGEDEGFEAGEMVPLVLIGRESGDLLEEYLERVRNQGAAALLVGVEERDKRTEGEAEGLAAMSLGGYAVVNCKVQR